MGSAPFRFHAFAILRTLALATGMCEFLWETWALMPCFLKNWFMAGAQNFLWASSRITLFIERSLFLAQPFSSSCRIPTIAETCGFSTSWKMAVSVWIAHSTGTPCSMNGCISSLAKSARRWCGTSLGMLISKVRQNCELTRFSLASTSDHNFTGSSKAGSAPSGSITSWSTSSSALWLKSKSGSRVQRW